MPDATVYVGAGQCEKCNRLAAEVNSLQEQLTLFEICHKAAMAAKDRRIAELKEKAR